MTIEKTLERLKKIHAQYEKSAAVLTEELSILQKKLDDAKTKQIQTFDAIQALTGQPTFSKIMEGMMLKTENKNFDKTPLHITPEHIPSDLPAPEPGMKWIQTPTDDGRGEWVLVPINPPPPLFVPGVGFGAPNDFDLPSVEGSEKFEDLSTFL